MQIDMFILLNIFVWFSISFTFFSDNESVKFVTVDCEWSDRIYASIFYAGQVNTLKLLVQHIKITFLYRNTMHALHFAQTYLRHAPCSQCFSGFKYCVFPSNSINLWREFLLIGNVSTMETMKIKEISGRLWQLLHVDLLVRIGGASDLPLGHRSNAVDWFHKVRMRPQFPSALTIWVEKEWNEGFRLLIQHTKMTPLMYVCITCIKAKQNYGLCSSQRLQRQHHSQNAQPTQGE